MGVSEDSEGLFSSLAGSLLPKDGGVLSLDCG